MENQDGGVAAANDADTVEFESVVRQKKIFKTFVDRKIEAAYQYFVWTHGFWAQLAIFAVLLSLRVLYIVLLFASGETAAGAIVATFLQLANVLALGIVLISLNHIFLCRPRHGGLTHHSRNEQLVIDSELIVAQHTPAPVTSTSTPINPHPDPIVRKASSRGRSGKFFLWYIRSGTYSLHWLFVLVCEAASVIAMDWSICQSEPQNVYSVCLSYNQGLFPLPPMITVMLAAFAIAMVSSLLISSFVSIGIIAALFVAHTVSLFQPPLEMTPGYTFDTIRVSFLAFCAFALSCAFVSAKQYAQRHSFSLLWVLQLQRQREKEQHAREAEAVDALNRAREEQIATATARGVQELTMGYVGHQAANVVHQLQFASDNLSVAEGMPASCGEDVAALQDALSKLKRILNDVLSHQKLLSGRVALNVHSCEVRNAFAGFLSKMRVAHNRDAILKVESDVPSVIYCDWFRVDQMLSNAMANAVAVGRDSHIQIVVKLVLAPTASEMELCTARGIVTEPRWLTTCEQYTEVVRRTSDVAQSLGTTNTLTSNRSSAAPGVILQSTRIMGRGSSVSEKSNSPSIPTSSSTPQRGFTKYPSPPGWSWWLHMEVQNEGPGLRTDDVLRLFLPFENPSNLMNDMGTYRTTGLGLPIVRLLANMMHARVGIVDVNTDTGSTLTRFFVQMHLDRVMQPPTAVLADAEAAATVAIQGSNTNTADGDLQDVTHVTTDATGRLSIVSPRLHFELSAGRNTHSVLEAQPSSQTAESEASMTTPKVLIVDDVEANRKVNARLVRKLGCVTAQATDGDEVIPAIQAAEHTGEPFDAIMLDIVMQRQHGDETCRRLRALGCRIPIIAASGNAAETDRSRYFASGFDAVIAKPFTYKEVKECFQQLGIIKNGHSGRSQHAHA